MPVSFSGSSGVQVFRSEYDGSNRVTKNEYTVSPAWNGVFRDTRSYCYAYDDSDGSLASMTLPANGSYTYTYDALKRLNTRALKLNNSAFINRSYSYLPGDGTNATTMLVSGVTNSRANGSNISSYTYSYDNVGNITSVSGSTVANYSYDNLGQLRTETYGGKTYTYSYDTAGNIVSVSDGTTTKNYVYGDSGWKDLLTSYNGVSINYDGIGNPTKWYDGTSFTWVNGRRLASAVNSSTGVNNSYTYDADGLRLTKTVNGVQHRYVWQGSQLVAEYYGGTELEFFYDESGAPYAFSYKANASATPVMYYYVTNLQGDVTNIVDASGNVNSTYTYNAWGKIIFSAGTMSAINPLRYRGYYYDSDTELYYLQSRYYDPEICRFVNADSYASTGQGIFGTNMFAYCVNNPVTCIDSAGESALAAASLGAGLFAAFSFLAEVGKKAAESLVDGLHSAIAKIDSIFEDAREKAEEIDRKHSKSYTVYALENPVTEQVEYVGRTTDLKKRLAQHDRDGSKTQGFTLYSSISNLTYSQARGLEEFGIREYSTLNKSRSADGPKNFILGISPNNKNALAYYVASQDYRNYVYNRVTNEIYNIFEISIFK